MRSAEFDREEVLRAAMIAFMRKGYGKTSMPDLTQATGLHPGSIYCAFGNKRGLLLAALAQYKQDRGAEFETFFSDERPVLLQLKSYLDNVVVKCLSCDATQACLLTKALNEIAEQDEEVQSTISEYLTDWQQGLTTKLEQAKETGELNTSRDCVHLARYLAMGIFGLRTFAHTHPEVVVLQQLADQLYQDVCR